MKTDLKKPMLFWNDISMYQNRIKEIFSILDKLDKERPATRHLTESIQLLPTTEYCPQMDEMLDDIYNIKPEKFFSEPRNYGIRSSNEQIKLGKGRTQVFNREFFEKFNLYTDYYSQVLLLILWDWQEHKEKSQE